jgi:hypothetical protein
MRISPHCPLVFLAVTLLGMPAFGQLSTGSGSSVDARIVASESNSKDALVAHQPIHHPSYTAELKTTNVRTLSDGTTITRETTGIRAWDSQNRMLNSTTRTVPDGEEQKTITNGRVDDPVESTQITWDSQTKVARVIHFPSPDQRHGCWVSESGQMHRNYGAGHPVNSGTTYGVAAASSTAVFPNPPPVHDPPTKEDLGTTTIQGIEVRGTRYTSVTPIGRIGNDKPLVQVNESWTAPGFGFSLRSMNDDPQSGKTTTETVNLDISEPPLSTFQPPDGYKIVQDELHQVACPEPGMPWQ